MLLFIYLNYYFLFLFLSKNMQLYIYSFIDVNNYHPMSLHLEKHLALKLIVQFHIICVKFDGLTFNALNLKHFQTFITSFQNKSGPEQHSSIWPVYCLYFKSQHLHQHNSVLYFCNLIYERVQFFFALHHVSIFKNFNNSKFII